MPIMMIIIKNELSPLYERIYKKGIGLTKQILDILAAGGQGTRP